MKICPRCGITFFTDDNFQKHWAKVHAIEQLEGALLVVDGEYLGGSGAYPSKNKIMLSVGQNEVYVHPWKLHIPYSSIKEVKNIDNSNMSALRVVVLGVAGALWKKKERYLCLVYNDEVQEQNPVFKFDKDKLEKVQTLIYQQVVKAKKLQK